MLRTSGTPRPVASSPPATTPSIPRALDTHAQQTRYKPLRHPRGTFLSLAVCRDKSFDSWFGGSPTRGLREICRDRGLPYRHRQKSTPAVGAWNVLQIVFHRFRRPIPCIDSWSEGNRLVVWGKRARGLREVDTWFEGKNSWFEGSRTRGLREKTRGLREVRKTKLLQIERYRSRFWDLLLFKYLLFLCCLTTTGKIG